MSKTRKEEKNRCVGLTQPRKTKEIRMVYSKVFKPIKALFLAFNKPYT